MRWVWGQGRGVRDRGGGGGMDGEGLEVVGVSEASVGGKSSVAVVGGDCSADWMVELGSGMMGVVVVGAGSMYWWMRSGTEEGVTLSMKVKAGRRRTVVGWGPGGWSWW